MIRPGVTRFTVRSQHDRGAAAHPVVRKRGQNRVGTSTHMAYSGLRSPCERVRVVISTCGGPGTGHNLYGLPDSHRADGFGGAWPWPQYVVKARKYIATLQRARPGVTIKTRGRPTQKGDIDDEKADEWENVAAEVADVREVKWQN